MRRAIFLALALSACEEHGQTPPADTAPDGDAPFDGLGDAPLPPLALQTLVMSTQRVPQNNTEAQTFGLDLDGDSTIDNGLGLVMSVFAGQGIATQAAMTRAIDRGLLLQLIVLGAEDVSFSSGKATFTMLTGDTPVPAPCANSGDTVCRLHLDGAGTFTVAATSAKDTPIAGDVGAQQLVTPVTIGGRFQLLTMVLTDTPIALDLVGARVVTEVDANGMTNGVIAGAITDTDIQTKMLPQMQTSIAAVVVRDCDPTPPPNCGCATNSDGASFISLFDTTPANCTITLAELQNNSLIQSLFAPDVQIAGEDALSVGVGFDAVLASFTP